MGIILTLLQSCILIAGMVAEQSSHRINQEDLDNANFRDGTGTKTKTFQLQCNKNNKNSHVRKFNSTGIHTQL